MNFDFAYTPSRGPDRSKARRQGEEAVVITEHGSYVAPSGRTVTIADAVRAAVSGTRDYRPEETVRLPSPGARATTMRVVNGTSLEAAREIASRGHEPFVLNFASAKNAGGGFLNGARAQEESLARASSLYECIRRSEMYAHHRACGDCLYSDWMIHSPSVPVFRDDDSGALLEEPYRCAFLTAPAPNAGEVLARRPDRLDEVNRTLCSRITRSLAIAAVHGHTHLVLGAWGCGVFKNSPVVVADAYRADLEGAFKGVFEEVVFAVLDWSEDRHFVRPFAERFA
ncbi:MAG: TIGR02452 family protein [Labilithrix sp.]